MTTIFPQPAWVATPAAQIERAKRQDWVQRLDLAGNYAYNNGNSRMDTVACDFGLASTNYSRPLYESDGSDADMRHVAGRQHGFNGYLPPEFIPAHLGVVASGRACVPKGMVPSLGRDGIASVLNKKTNQITSYWGLSVNENKYSWTDPRYGSSSDNIFGVRPQHHGLGWPGFILNSSLWAVSATIEVVNVSDQGNLNCHSIVAPKYVGVPQAEEVAAGAITHALLLCTAGRCNMTGPLAPDSVQDPDDPSVGVQWGLSCSPAPVVEGAATFSTNLQLLGQVPEGMRFVLIYSRAEIDAWVASRNFPTQALANTARIFAIALCDYGFYIGVSSAPDGAAQFPCDGSPSAVTQWKQLGITSDPVGKSLLHGLIVPEKMVALRPPQATRLDGSASFREGPATSFTYEKAA